LFTFFTLIETFNNLLRAAAFSGENNAVNVVLEQMQKSGIALNEQTHRMILLGMAFCPNSVQVKIDEIRENVKNVKDLTDTLDPRTSGAIILGKKNYFHFVLFEFLFLFPSAYLRIGDVNNAVSVLQKEILQKRADLVVPFSIWNRLLECYERQFFSPVWKTKPNRQIALEGAMMKIFRWMQEAYGREGIKSAYSKHRWREAFLLLLSKLGSAENLQLVYEKIHELDCFSNASDADLDKLHVFLIKSYLSDETPKFEEALKVLNDHLTWKSCFREVFAYVVKVIKMREAEEEVCETLDKFFAFCKEHEIVVTDVKVIRKHLRKRKIKYVC
jgi:hypothetical protein